MASNPLLSPEEVLWLLDPSRLKFRDKSRTHRTEQRPGGGRGPGRREKAACRKCRYWRVGREGGERRFWVLERTTVLSRYCGSWGEWEACKEAIEREGGAEEESWWKWEMLMFHRVAVRLGPPGQSLSKCLEHRGHWPQCPVACLGTFLTFFRAAVKSLCQKPPFPSSWEV